MKTYSHLGKKNEARRKYCNIFKILKTTEGKNKQTNKQTKKKLQNYFKFY